MSTPATSWDATVISNIGEASSLTPSQIIYSLNQKGFTISIFQGSFATSGQVDERVPRYLWHGSAYSRDRHLEWSKKRYLPYEELIKEPCFFFQLVAHHHNSLEECLEKLWQEYLSPTVPPRATRTSFNPAFGRHKKKGASRSITDDDLLA